MVPAVTGTVTLLAVWGGWWLAATGEREEALLTDRREAYADLIGRSSQCYLVSTRAPTDRPVSESDSDALDALRACKLEVIVSRAKVGLVTNDREIIQGSLDLADAVANLELGADPDLLTSGELVISEGPRVDQPEAVTEPAIAFLNEMLEFESLARADSTEQVPLLPRDLAFVLIRPIALIGLFTGTALILRAAWLFLGAAPAARAREHTAEQARQQTRRAELRLAGLGSPEVEERNVAAPEDPATAVTLSQSGAPL